MIWILTVAIGSLFVVQWWLVRGFEKFMRRKEPEKTNDSFRPAVAVILCARGADPFLESCLAALSQQDWPDYRVYFVTDDLRDPAVSVFENFLQAADSDRFELRVTAAHNVGRSLKCNSLFEVCSSLDPRFDVVALIDSDVVPGAQWITRLVAPLANDSTAASCGMRWFEPNSNQLGSQIRAIWNAAAIVQMNAYAIAWGGSLAIKRRALEMCGVLDAWQTALFDDVLVGPMLARHGLNTRTCDDLILVNREEINLANAARWIKRQLLDARLYHPRWSFVFFHAIGVSGLAVSLLVFGLISLFFGKMFTAAVCFAGLAVIQLSNRWLLTRIEQAVNYALREHAENPLTRPKQSWVANLIVVSLTQVVHLAAAFSAQLARSVRWRGVQYDIRGPHQIRMRQYVPMKEIQSSAATSNENSLDSIV